MANATSIIFGPTGNVGSAVVHALHERGSGKIALAMRDPSKTIPGLDTGLEEKSGGRFERVKADLGDPDSMRKAVQQTGATQAFLYLNMHSQDHMRGSIAALRDAGVVFAVFLSSAAVPEDRRAATQESFVTYVHAQVEIALEDALGPRGFVAVRPGWFDTNARWWGKGIREGDVKIPYGEAKGDWQAPEDIGAVAGALLARGGQLVEGENAVYVTGPRLVSIEYALKAVAKAAGKEIKVTNITEQKPATESLVAAGLPEGVAAGIVKALIASVEGHNIYSDERHAEIAKNIERYTGRPSMTIEQWAEKHKHEFGA